MKMEITHECDKWRSQNPGRVIKQAAVGQLVKEALKKQHHSVIMILECGQYIDIYSQKILHDNLLTPEEISSN